MSRAASASVAWQPPAVHAAWTARWFAGDTHLAAAFGPPPSEAALLAQAQSLDVFAGRTARADWRDLLAPSARTLPSDALVVIAGQQPMLGGGPALVAHKAATAVRLAAHLAEAWQRAVVPVFLFADEDHDSDEVDHLDLAVAGDDRLERLRCPIHPGHDCFFRSRWDYVALPAVLERLGVRGADAGAGGGARRAEAEDLCGHVEALLLASFGHLGLRTVRSHALTERAQTLLLDALEEPAALRDALAAGAERLAAAHLPASFDAADPRPLVLESRAGRRRRLAAGDPDAVARLRRSPQDFSPDAALRPVVQGAALPVVAQVAGPSELLYLAQARGLHARAGVPAPVLVPRLEATAVPPALLEQLGVELDALSFDARPDDPAERRLLEAAEAFARRVEEGDAALSARARRWLADTARGARRLVESLAWRGGTPPGSSQRLRPRGNPQDTVLAWAPDACAGDPARWGSRIVELCRPLDPPAHAVYVIPD